MDPGKTCKEKKPRQMHWLKWEKKVEDTWSITVEKLLVQSMSS